MKIIISCSNRKNGKPLKYKDKIINFTSRKDEIDQKQESYFHPDDLIPNENISWRDLISLQELVDLTPAHNMYKNKIYNSLYNKFGNDLFIYSAGWGIVRADFKLPNYNITFSKGNNIPLYAKRNFNDEFNDYNQLKEIDENERLIFIAGKDYVLPFCNLSQHLSNEIIILHSSLSVLKNNKYLSKSNFHFVHYKTNLRTNWHYEFARKLITNDIII